MNPMSAPSKSVRQLSEQEFLDTRLYSLGLAVPAADSGPQEARDHVHRMLAVQGQDLPGTLWAIASRTSTTSRDQVEQLFNGKQLVRSWPFRGTLHVMTPENAFDIMRVMGPRSLKSTMNMRLHWDMDDAFVDRARAILLDVLADGSALTRSELLEAWNANGLEVSSQQAYRLILTVCLHGDVVWAPIRGKEQAMALAPWVESPDNFEPLSDEETLDKIVLGIVAGRGPISLDDICYWTKLGKGVIGASLTRLDGTLEQCNLAGDPNAQAFYCVVGTVDLAAVVQHQGALLNPGFDEFLLGYKERGPQLHGGGIDLVVPGRNGVFKPNVAYRGRVVGTWSKKDRAKDSVLQVQLFDKVRRTKVLEKEIEKQVKRYGAFHDRPMSFEFVGE